MMKTKSRPLIYYFLFTIIMILVIASKRNLHIDETFSYGSSNDVDGMWMSFENGVTYTPACSIFEKYLTAGSQERFEFSHVWRNQANDVHPPLYYAVFHFLCSFFPEKYSIWFGGSINIFFALLTLYFVRKIIMELTEDNGLRILVSGAFILSVGILQNVSFFRMYVMAMLWVTATTWLFLRYAEKTLTWKFYAAIFAVSALGALTHYYCIVWLALCCVVFGVILLLGRREKELAYFCLDVAAAGRMSVLIFPQMTMHMFSGYRGEQSIKNLTSENMEDYWSRLQNFFSFLNGHMFGGMLIYLVIIGVLLCLASLFVKPKRVGNTESFYRILAKRIQGNHVKIKQYLLLLVPLTAYFLLVSKMAAYVLDRYLFPIYAVAFVCCFCLLGEFINKIFSKEVYSGNVFSQKAILQKVLSVRWSDLVTAVFLIAVTVGGWNYCKWDYLYSEAEPLLEEAAKHSDTADIFVYDAKWKVGPSYYELSNYQSVTFVPQDNLDLLYGLEAAQGTELMLTIIGDEASILNRVMEILPSMTSYEKIGSYAYSSTYYLYGESVLQE